MHGDAARLPATDLDFARVQPYAYAQAEIIYRVAHL